jgi:hypothetical protein
MVETSDLVLHVVITKKNLADQLGNSVVQTGKRGMGGTRFSSGSIKSGMTGISADDDMFNTFPKFWGKFWGNSHSQKRGYRWDPIPRLSGSPLLLYAL